MTRLEKIYEGKAKIVYATDDPDVYVQDFKDSATAFDGTKKGTILEKGRMNNAISARLFTLLEEAGVRTHFLGMESQTAMRIRRLDMLQGGARGAERGGRLALQAHRLAGGHRSQEPAHHRDLPQGRRAPRSAAVPGPSRGVGDRHPRGAGAEVTRGPQDQHRAAEVLLRPRARSWSISSWSSAATARATSFSVTRSPPTPAGCGTPRHRRSSTKTVSAATWAAWRRRTPRCSAASWRAPA